MDNDNKRPSFDNKISQKNTMLSQDKQRNTMIPEEYQMQRSDIIEASIVNIPAPNGISEIINEDKKDVTATTNKTIFIRKDL